MKKILASFLILISLLSLFTGCTTDTENKPQGESQIQSSTTTTESVNVDSSNPTTDMFTERDFKTEYDESNAVTIKLNGASATASSDSVNISGSTITITEEATYIVSGELTDGMLIVNAPDSAKLQIVLSGANITNKTSAALYILEADKVFLTLADGTTNTLANGGTFTAIDDNNIDAALFSKQDLTMNGKGSLTVTSPAGHGVVCKDDLVVTGGTYTVNSSPHGLDVNDSVRITNATLNIDAGKDAIHAENTDDTSLGFIYIGGGTIKAEAEGDGIAAGAYIQIADGMIDLLVGGGSENGIKENSDNFGGFMGGGHGGGRPGEMRPDSSQGSTITTDESSTSMKGLKATNSLLISGGNFTINSADDSVHSDVSVIINGGTFGTFFAWTHAVVDIYGATIDTLYCGTCDSTKHSWMTIHSGTKIDKVICCEPRCPYGTKEYSTTMTIKSGAEIGSLQLVSTDVEFLIIEEGAKVGKITCEGVEYTYEELRSAMGL